MLDKASSTDEKLVVLKEKYPRLAIEHLKVLKRDEELKSYMDECETMEKDEMFKSYWKYIHGFWLPTLEKERAEGKLTQGKAFANVYDFKLYSEG